jgi:hypothetical protein
LDTFWQCRNALPACAKQGRVAFQWPIGNYARLDLSRPLARKRRGEGHSRLKKGGCCQVLLVMQPTHAPAPSAQRPAGRRHDTHRPFCPESHHPRVRAWCFRFRPLFLSVALPAKTAHRLAPAAVSTAARGRGTGCRVCFGLRAAWLGVKQK